MTIGIYKATAADVMTQGADSIRDVDSIHAAIEKMVDLGLSAMPVVNQRMQCVGVLSKTDIVKLAGALDVEDRLPRRNDLAALYFGVGLDEITNAKVEDVMTSDVVGVRPNELLTNVVTIMLRHEIHHVPVCDSHNRVVGMISSMDVLKAI